MIPHRAENMVFIIGIDHLVQYNGPVPEFLRIQFKEYIKSIVRVHAVEIIAEEFSEEALREVYGATEGTAHKAAAEAGVQHRFCDPDEKELAELGIPHFAEIEELVMHRHSLTASFIIDDALRKKLRREADAVASSYWPIREEHWFRKLEDDMGRNILFICGHEHANRFHDLVSRHGHGSIVIDPFWRGELFRDYETLFRMGDR